MNVFEDLIVELKEENLLEETVIKAENAVSESPEIDELTDGGRELSEKADQSGVLEANEETPDTDPVDETESDNKPDFEVVSIIDEGAAPVEAALPKTKKAKAGKEYFNKRAVDEMSSLQMVEHILTGVEREYMKVKPKAFDDFNAKKALHNFLAVTENSKSEEHKAAEFALMHETEAWGVALTERDRNIAVANIRRYCENSRPALSSQAMLALARFYRNAPYSEPVRSKFDFVITRLFSRPLGQDKRLCLFDREQMLTHINTLYSEWSSIPIYDADSDESNIELTGMSFDDLATEAENAANFDQLIESDFFGRMRLFKESISEVFYAPTVITAAIESNIRIGNAYVNLIVRERRKMDAASIQMKYGDFDGQSVSDAAGRTLDLVELLHGLTDEAIQEEEFASDNDNEVSTESLDADSPKFEVAVKKERPPFVENLIHEIRDINRWILAVGFVFILISGGLYVWSANMPEEKVSTVGVQAVELNGFLGEQIKSAKINRDTFYGLMLPSWDNLSKEKREEYLKKIYQLGNEKGFKQVNLTNKDGKQAGFISATQVDVNMP
jgi:hypothetical protein